MGTRVSGVDHWLRLNGVPLSFRRGDENLEAQATEYQPNRLRITSDAPDDLEIRDDDGPIETEVYGRWNWSPRGYAGLYQLTVTAPGYPPQMTLVRVLPSKLSYERYQQMLKDINEVSIDLLLDLHSPASEKATLRYLRQHPSALRDYELLHPLVRSLGNVIEHIRRSPYRTLSEREESRLFHEVSRFSSDLRPTPGASVKLSSPLSQELGLEYLPQQWVVHEAVLTYDVYENRLLKHFLWRQLLTRIYSIGERAQQEMRRREQQRVYKVRQGWEDDESNKIKELEKIVEKCQAMMQRCIGWGNMPFLRTVQSLTLGNRPTQVLQKHPYYSRFYQLYLRFQQELSLSFNTEQYVTRLALRRMSELYEFWAVFQLTHVALDLLKKAKYVVVSSNGFFEASDDGFMLNVKPEAAIELLKGDLRLVFRYIPVYLPTNRVMSGIISTTNSQLTPDLTLEVWQENQAKKLLVFDAKYRSQSDGAAHTYLDEDREKMDFYFNSLRWKVPDPRQRPRKIVSSAYILYPGDIVEHVSEEPEVGALPFVPKLERTQLVKQILGELFQYAGLL